MTALFIAKDCIDYWLQELGLQRQKKYEELSKRLEREKQLSIIAQKLETKKNLLVSTGEKPKQTN